jgi:RNA polymerase sigma-70 factor (ECF subfamily)
MMATEDPPRKKDITTLLQAWNKGDASALDQLTPLIYHELQRLARRYMSQEQPGSTLETGAVLNEAFMRLIRWKAASWENRSHFYGLAAKIMRRVLVDHARSRGYQKRGGALRPVSLDEGLVISAERAPDLVTLNDALERLEVLDPRKSKVVELRFFAGLTNEETAAVLQVSPFTVIRDWNFAKTWLHRELAGKKSETESSST